MAHNHSHDYDSTDNIKTAFLLNFIFTIVEIIGGLWTNSIAIFSDALHDLGDSLSLGLAWFLDNYSKKGPDQKFTFGYARFSLLGALINSVILVGGSIFILTRAIPRLFNPQTVKPKGMIVFALVGIIVNGIAAWKMRSGSSMNEKVVTWHLLEDVLGWAAVLVVSIILLYKKLPILDPILSIGITSYILYNILQRLKEVLDVFLQGTPEGISVEKLEKKIAKHTAVVSVHHTHVWSLDGEYIFLSTHLEVLDNCERDEIIKLKSNVKSLLKEENIDHITLEVEYRCEECNSIDCFMGEN